METFSALLPISEGNPPVIDGFPSQGQWRGVPWSAPEQTVEQTIEMDAGNLRRHRAHYDATVMHMRTH